MSSKQSPTDSEESVDTEDDAQNTSTNGTVEEPKIEFDEEGVDPKELLSPGPQSSEEDGQVGGTIENPDHHEFSGDDSEDVDGEESSADDDGEEPLRQQVISWLEDRLADEETVDERLARYELADDLDLESDDEDMIAILGEVSSTDENGHIQGIDAGGLPYSEDEDYVPSWENIRSIYAATTGKEKVYQTKYDKQQTARKAAADRLMQDGNWIWYAPNDTGEKEFYYYEEEIGKYLPDENGRLENHLEKKLGVHYHTREVEQIKAKLQARASCGYDSVNARHMDGTYVNTANCVIRIDPDAYNGPWNWETHEHSPEFRFISQSVDNAEYCYDISDGVDLNKVNLEWTIDWLRSMFEDNDDHSWKVLMEIFGASLRPDQYFKFFAMLAGPTNAGKSRAIGAWRGTLNEDNTSGIEFQQLAEGEFDSSEMFRRGGRMMNTGSDIEKKKLEKTAALKTFTTNDYVSHSVKHDWPINAISPAAQIHSTNKEVFMDPDDGAIPSRLKYLRFPFRFESTYKDTYDPNDEYIKPADPELEEKLRRPEVRNALLLLALEGLYRLYENEKKFSFEKSESDRWSEYISRADTTGRFATDCLQNVSAVNDDGLDCYLTVDDIGNVFQHWRQANGKSSKSTDQLMRELNQVSLLEMHSQRTSRTSPGNDKENVRWRLALTEKGMNYCEDPNVIDRMTTEFGVVDPDSDDSGSGGSDEESREGGQKLIDRVESAIVQQGNLSSSGATRGGILNYVDGRTSEKVDVNEFDSVLMRGVCNGRFEMDDDNRFIVTSGEEGDE